MNDSTQDADLFPCEGTNDYPWPYPGGGSSSLCWLFWHQVRPRDIIGCDGDRVVVVPLELAEGIAVHARAVPLADVRGMRKLYEGLGMTLDETVDYETGEAYNRQFESSFSGNLLAT